MWLRRRGGVEYRIVGPAHEGLLADLFANVDETYFHPHPFTPDEARRIAQQPGRDLFAILVNGTRAMAYGMLRGWDEGFLTPSLGVAVRNGYQGRGLGRRMMEELHRSARARGASRVRLRVHSDNSRARLLYESLGYVYRGRDRGELVMTLDLSASDVQGGTAPPGVVVLRPDDPGWDSSLADVSASVFHTAGYHLYSAGFGQGDPYLAVVGDAAQGLAWPYLLRPIADVPGWEGAGVTDVHSVYGYPGPLAWGCKPGDAFLQAAWSLLTETWRGQRAVTAFTRFNPVLQNAALMRGLTVGHRDSTKEGVIATGRTVVVDLTLSDDVIRAAFGRGVRREIARTQDAGLRTIEDRDWVHLTEFVRLYHEAMVRNGASEDYFFTEDDFLRLRSSLPGCVHLLVSLLGDSVAAGSLFIEHGGTMEWHLAGSNHSPRGVSPSKALVAAAIPWARDRGNRILHLGGGRGGREDSLFFFKGQFSPERHLFHTGRWVLDPQLCDQLDAARRASLPASVRLDPNYFPPYRAPALSEGVRPSDGFEDP